MQVINYNQLKTDVIVEGGTIDAAEAMCHKIIEMLRSNEVTLDVQEPTQPNHCHKFLCMLQQYLELEDNADLRDKLQMSTGETFQNYYEANKDSIAIGKANQDLETARNLEDPIRKLVDKTRKDLL